MIDKIAVEEKSADDLGTTRDLLTEQQQTQAFLNEIIVKGTEVTKNLGDEMVRSATRGTKALKEVETGATSFLNFVGRGFVSIGKGIGETIASMVVASSNSLEDLNKAWMRYQSEYEGSNKLTLKEFKEYYKNRFNISSDYLKKMEDDYTQYILYTKDEELESFENFKKSQIAKYGVYVEALNEEKKVLLKHKKMLKKIEAEEMDKVSNLVQVGGRWVPKTQIALSKKVDSDLLNHLAKSEKAKEVREKKANKDLLNNKKKIIDDIIRLDKILMQYDKAGFVKKLEMDKEYQEQRKELNKSSLQQLKEDQLASSRAVDSYNESAIRIENAKKTNEALLQAQKDFDDAVLELAKRNAEQKKAITLAEYKAKKEAKDKERELSERHFNTLKQYGSDYLNAIITGNAEAIPKILAQQAMMFGQEIFWDGLKTLWFGTSKNAMFPGWGTSATAVGVAEMAAGAGLMAVGGIASNALNSAPSSASGSKERNKENDSSRNINMSVTTSLYGSKTEAKKELNSLM